MKRIAIALVSVLAALSAAAQVRHLPAWQEGCLDIHNIATKCGDCTFIVMPDGTTMLIDAGDMRKSSWDTHALPDDSRTPAEWIVNYIDKVAKPGAGKIDYMLLTHFHADHMGNVKALSQGRHGYKVAGLSEVGEHLPFGKIVDRGWPDYAFPSAEYVEKSNKGFMPEYRKFVEYQVREGGAVAEKFAVGSKKQFQPVHDPASYKGRFEIFNVAGNASRATGKGRKTVKMYASSEDPLKFDENMFSCAIRLQYGKFVYFNGGDLSGNNYGPGKRPSHNRDYESQIADLVGPVTVLKADHHGWKDTCNPYFMWRLAPEAIVFQASHIRHPWWETVRRLIDPQLPGAREMYVTSDSGKVNIPDEFWQHLHAPGHVVIRVYPGGDSWQVFTLDALSGGYGVIEESELKKL